MIKLKVVSVSLRYKGIALMALSYLVLLKAFIMHVARYPIDQISKISLGHSNAASSLVSFRFDLFAVDAGCCKVSTTH